MANKEITEIGAIGIIDNTFSRLNDNEARDRVLRWAFQKYASKSLLSEMETEENKIKGPKPGKKGKKVKKKAKAKKSGKIIYSVVKELNLNPKGKKSFSEFSEGKKPRSIKEKCALCIYYLVNILKSKQNGINHVYTCFKNKKWRIPKDLRNMLHQTASEGWLDTSSQDDIKITPIGENLIEHDLPKKKKEKK